MEKFNIGVQKQKDFNGINNRSLHNMLKAPLHQMAPAAAGIWHPVDTLTQIAKRFYLQNFIIFQGKNHRKMD